MKVKVNVYLKSGGNASTVVVCESMAELRNDYMRNMSSPLIVHGGSDTSSIQIIPTENIAWVNFEEAK